MGWGGLRRYPNPSQTHLMFSKRNLKSTIDGFLNF